MKRLFFTPLALSDLEELLDYIAIESPERAVKFVEFLIEKAELIATQPLIGRIRSDLPGNYRSHPIGRFQIFYVLVDDTVEIHRVLDGRREVSSLLK